MDWREYQRAAAGFFDSLDMQTEIEAAVVGARGGEHKIDVLVTFTAYGIDHVWLVECKLWKTRVPKEKVLAFRSIVDEVGADRGFLLSESDFQSGAVTQARFTNITLTNLEDLRANAEADVQEVRWQELYSRTIRCEDRIASDLQVLGGTDKKTLKSRPERPIHQLALVIQTRPGVESDDLYFRRANLSLIERGLQLFRSRRLPIPYSYVKEDNRVRVARDLADFLARASETLDEIEQWIETESGKPWPDKPERLT